MGMHVAACMANLTLPYDMVGPMVWEDDFTNKEFIFQDRCLDFRIGRAWASSSITMRWRSIWSTATSANRSR